jgi:nucleotide-binding universal stress UspA family protein
MNVVAVGILAWLCTGALVAISMVRHGHAPLSWTFVGLVLGPLSIPLAFDARAHRRSRVAVTSWRGDGTKGPVSIIAGIDGSPEAVTAVQEAAALLGERLGRVRLVAVIHQDAADNSLMFKDEREAAERWLNEAGEAVAGGRAEQLVVAGEPVEVLTGDLAADFDLVVIGPRGRGLAKRIRGSVATQLPGRARVPVLIGGGSRGDDPFAPFASAGAASFD